MFKNIFFLVGCLVGFSSLPAQNCFQVESILVNACGADEGLNEMVRFKVGNNPLNTNDITITWPSAGLNWGGTVKNSVTAGKVASFNAQIQNCGFILEPINNILPANATVILATSYNISTTANSFAGLSDTIYMIFQNKNVTGGHFGNTVPVGQTRTFKMNFTGCTQQVVVYDNTINNVDGATVNVDNQGNVSYSYPGCVAPVTPFTIEAGSNFPGCKGQSFNLVGAVTGSYTNVQWSGGNGTFSTPNALATQYTVGNNEADPIVLYFSATNCNNITIKDSLFITNNSPQVNITEGNFIGACPGTSLTLHATGNGTISWPGISTNANATINAAGAYLATASNACGIDSAFITVVYETTPTIQLPQDTTMCPGDQLVLDVTYPGATYLWQDNSTNATFQVTQPGAYSVTVSNQCGGTATATINVHYGAGPQAVLNDTSLNCAGTIILDAKNSGASYLWSTLETTQTIIVTQEGTYSVAIALCGDTITNTINVSKADLAQLKNKIPNVFSPNGDGNNDEYKIPLNPSDVDQFQVSIFNRWGFLVYSSKEANFVWNGTFNNQTVSSGTYFYVIDAVQNCETPQPFNFKGTITVFN